MTRLRELTPALHDLADTQLGLVTAAQLAELGIRTDVASRRVAGGMWTRVLPGVHLVDGGQPNRIQREYAGFLYAGAPARVTGLTGLRHHGLRTLGLQLARTVGHEVDPVHLLIGDGRRRLSTGYVRIERTHRLPDPVRLPGVPFPLTPVARAVADAARRMRHPGDVKALAAEAVQRELCTPADLSRELEEGQRRGSALLRDALQGLEAGARSGPEIDLVALMAQARISGVVYNARLLGPDGLFLSVADAWIDDVGVAVEVDSEEHHASGDGFARTVRRNARYAAAGVPVVTILPADQRDSPQTVVAAVQAAVAAASRRPRPAVPLVEHAGSTAQQRGWRYGA